MKAILLFLILLFSFISKSQSNRMFDITEVITDDSTQIRTEDDFLRRDTSFFEDEKYVVRKTCRGEWGGTIWFKNKKSGKEYSCKSSCPVVINFIDGKYIVTNTLSHRFDFSQIIEIANPNLLSVFKYPKKQILNGRFYPSTGADFESQSTKGSRQLLDSTGILTLASFPYKGFLYHIITDAHKTFVAKIVNKTFVTIDTISNESISTSDPEVIRTVDDHYIVFFNNNRVNGYMDIIDNKINIIRFK